MTPYGRRWRRLVARAIERSPACEDCGSTADLTGDHRIPRSRGGLDVPANVAVRCRRCNSRKGSHYAAPFQLRMDWLAGTGTAS